MTIMHAGKFARRAALVASTALFATCAPTSITSPPMRAAPEGPAMAAKRITALDASHMARITLESAARGTIAIARIALI